MAQRGVDVTYETIRQWCRKFGQQYANALRRRARAPATSGTWTRCSSRSTARTSYLWRAVDQDGNVLDILVQSRRNQAAAEKFFRKLLKGLRVRAAGADHRQARELRGGEEEAAAGRRASAAQGAEQPGGELAPADPPAGTGDAAVQVARSSTAVPGRPRADRRAFPAAAASADGRRAPAGSGRANSRSGTRWWGLPGVA